MYGVKLYEFRLSRVHRAKKYEFSVDLKLKNTSKMVYNSWKVPTILPVFRNSKGIKDPIEFVEKFERICEVNGI